MTMPNDDQKGGEKAAAPDRSSNAQRPMKGRSTPRAAQAPTPALDVTIVG